jgi:hypothetical protein
MVRHIFLNETSSCLAAKAWGIPERSHNAERREGTRASVQREREREREREAGREGAKTK